jgi:hypothetical protein
LVAGAGKCSTIGLAGGAAPVVALKIRNAAAIALIGYLQPCCCSA